MFPMIVIGSLLGSTLINVPLNKRYVEYVAVVVSFCLHRPDSWKRIPYMINQYKSLNWYPLVN